MYICVYVDMYTSFVVSAKLRKQKRYRPRCNYQYHFVEYIFEAYDTLSICIHTYTYVCTYNCKYCVFIYSCIRLFVYEILDHDVGTY